MCTRPSDVGMLNYNELHGMAGRATPINLMYYKMSLQLHKTFNLRIPTTDWTNLNINSVITLRQTTFITNKTNNYRIGMNALSNWLWYLNGKIKLDWLNLTINSFKIKCKKLFLKWWEQKIKLWLRWHENNNYNWDNLHDCPLFGLLFYLLTDAVLMQKMLTCAGFSKVVNSIIFL